MGDTTKVRAFTVASGIVIQRHRLLLVQNQRRNGATDWSPPGGVVDPGEGVLEALTREVNEETALEVTGWSPMLYAVEADFAERELTLRAEVYRADVFTGTLAIADPDEVVVDGAWVDVERARSLLGHSPRWVGEPLGHAIARLYEHDDPHGVAPPDPPAVWRYRVDEAAITDEELAEAGGDTSRLRRRRSYDVVLIDRPE